MLRSLVTASAARSSAHNTPRKPGSGVDPLSSPSRGASSSARRTSGSPRDTMVQPIHTTDLLSPSRTGTVANLSAGASPLDPSLLPGASNHSSHSLFTAGSSASQTGGVRVEPQPSSSLSMIAGHTHSSHTVVEDLLVNELVNGTVTASGSRHVVLPPEAPNQSRSVAPALIAGLVPSMRNGGGLKAASTTQSSLLNALPPNVSSALKLATAEQQELEAAAAAEEAAVAAARSKFRVSRLFTGRRMWLKLLLGILGWFSRFRLSHSTTQLSLTDTKQPLLLGSIASGIVIPAFCGS